MQNMPARFRTDHYQTRGDHAFFWQNGGNLKQYRGDYAGKNKVDQQAVPHPHCRGG